jgi:serine/threonine-protein kinase SRK2
MPKQEAPSRDLLEGHPRYKKLRDLNEGTFGVVMLALDQVTNERVSLIWNTMSVDRLHSQALA